MHISDSLMIWQILYKAVWKKVISLDFNGTCAADQSSGKVNQSIASHFINYSITFLCSVFALK